MDIFHSNINKMALFEWIVHRIQNKMTTPVEAILSYSSNIMVKSMKRQTFNIHQKGYISTLSFMYYKENIFDNRVQTLSLMNIRCDHQVSKQTWKGHKKWGLLNWTLISFHIFSSYLLFNLFFFTIFFILLCMIIYIYEIKIHKYTNLLKK